jgi:hypothetical protein
VRVKIGSTTYDTNPSTGCVTFSSGSSVHDTRVYAYATDANDNFARIHDGAQDATGTYPGSTFSHFIDDQAYTPGGTTTIRIGADTARWTAMGVLTAALYRYHDGVSDVEYHIAESSDTDSPDCDNRTYENQTGDNETYIRLSDDSCGSPGQQRKFVVAHEYGHGLAAQFANVNTTPFYAGHDVTPSDCSFTSAGGGAYGMITKEWSAVGKEGFADFVSAKVWNDYDNDGVYTTSPNVWDLERWNEDNDPRGYLRNMCVPGSSSADAASLDGAGVRVDWLLAYWDIYYYSGCSPSMTKHDMLRFYKEIITDSGIDACTSGANEGDCDNWFPVSRDAIDTVIGQSQIGTCYDDQWDFYACHNGIDFLGDDPPPSGGC